MISVKIQLKRHMLKLVKNAKIDCEIQHDSFSEGVLYYKSNSFINYYDKKCFYKFENSTNDFNNYKLHIVLYLDNIFKTIDNTIVTIKE